jgi:hypothetical protein
LAKDTDDQNQPSWKFPSASRLIDIYALDAEGQVKSRNKQLAVPGGKRGISSLSFGYGYFWDCLAAGMEGLDNGLSNDGLQGGVR